MTARHAHMMQAVEEVVGPVCGMAIAPENHANYEAQLRVGHRHAQRLRRVTP